MNCFTVKRLSGCRHCGSSELLKFLTLSSLPLPDEFVRTREDFDGEFLGPVDIYLCRQCGLVQTQHDVNVGAYYRDYQFTTGSSGFSNTFMRELAEEIFRRFAVKPGETVVEVGSGDGLQLSHFQTLGARVIGFEPSEALCKASRERGVPVLNQLYVPGSERDIPTEMRPARAVVLTYTFDHLPDPVAFAKSVRPMLDPRRGLLIIEVHDFEKIFERREFCLFAHEHSIYPTAATLQMLLRSAGYETLEVGLLPENHRRGNSLLVVATPSGSELAADALPTLDKGKEADAEACLAFGTRVMASLEGLRQYVAKRRAAGKRLAGYGAGGRGVMTLAATATAEDYLYVCDQNQSFHGFLTPGAHIPVVPPEQVFADPPDELIVFSFGYLAEIRARYADFERSGGRITSLLDLL